MLTEGQIVVLEDAYDSLHSLVVLDNRLYECLRIISEILNKPLDTAPDKP